MFTREVGRVRETFERNQLQSIRPFDHNFYRFSQDLMGCKFVAIHLDRPILSYISFQVPANFFFVVMTTDQELGH
jgi:hypothetical protein